MTTSLHSHIREMTVRTFAYQIGRGEGKLPERERGKNDWAIKRKES